MQSEKAVVIIPCFNEAEVIEETIHQVFKATKTNSNFEIFILVFDSASTDETPLLVANLQSLYPNLLFQSEPQKTGLGSAYLQAMQYALHELQADVVVEFDADLSHQPVYLNPMLELIQRCDVVVGSRYVKGGSIPNDWGWHRKFLSVLGNYIARIFLTGKYKDFTSGFRVTRSKLLKKALPESFLSNAYAYKLELLWRLHQNKARIVEYPIDFIDRKKGYSKLPTNSIVDSLRVLWRLRFAKLQSYLRMCLVGSVGLGVQFLIYNILRSYFTPFHAAQVAIGCAIMNNYLLNNKFTFKHPASWTRLNKLKSAGFFLTYSLTMIIGQSYWMHWITKILGPGFLKENVVLFIGTLLCSFLNYFVYSRIVWQENKIRKVF